MTDTATETEAERTSRSQMWKHEDAVAWLTEEGFITPESSQAEVVAAFAANRNDYRRTDRYRTLVDQHTQTAAQAREQAAAERQAAKEAKEAERAAAKAEKEAAAKAKAAEPEKPAEPAKATRKGKRGKAAAESTESTSEDPFG